MTLIRLYIDFNMTLSQTCYKVIPDQKRRNSEVVFFNVPENYADYLKQEKPESQFETPAITLMFFKLRKSSLSCIWTRHYAPPVSFQIVRSHNFASYTITVAQLPVFLLQR